MAACGAAVRVAGLTRGDAAPWGWGTRDAAAWGTCLQLVPRQQHLQPRGEVFKGRSPVVAVFNRSSSREEAAHGAPMVLKSTHVAQMQSTFGGLLECAPTALQHPAYVATPCHQA